MFHLGHQAQQADFQKLLSVMLFWETESRKCACGMGRLACFLSTAPALCRAAVSYVGGGRDQSREKRTRGTWFCLFALAGPQRGMVFTNIPDVVGSKKKGPEAMYRQTALAAFRVYSLYFPSVGQRWNLPLPWKNIWCQLVRARF